MSDNVHPVPRLRKIKGCAVKHHPFNTIPQFRKRTEDGLKRPEAVMRYESGNIFKQKSCRSFFLDNSGKFKEKSASRVCKSSGISRRYRVGLAGKTADKQVEIGHSCCVNSCNVAIINLPLRVINGFVSRRGVLVNFAVPNALKAARFFQTAAESADSGKAIEKFNCYKITPLKIFLFDLHRHFRLVILHLGLLGDFVEAVYLGTDTERPAVVEFYVQGADIIDCDHRAFCSRGNRARVIAHFVKLHTSSARIMLLVKLDSSSAHRHNNTPNLYNFLC